MSFDNMSFDNSSHLIVGAGPVGLTLALELKRRGITPTIIDNDGVPTPESRALGINSRTLEIFEPSGITERLLKAGHKLNGVIVRKNNNTLMKVNLNHIPHRFNFLLVLPQSQTEEILIEALKQQAVDINWYNTLKKLEPEASNFQCTIDTKDGIQTHSFPHIFGADGAHSTVRKQLDIAFDGESIKDQWSMADVHISDWPHPFDHAVINLYDFGPVAFLPIKEGFGRIICNQPDILNRVPKNMKIDKVEWQSDFKVSYRQVDTYQQGNAFLLGDAAHIHSPAGARGMNLGIEDAATLAYLLERKQQAQYTTQRHPIGQKILKLTKQQTTGITSTGFLFDMSVKIIAPLVLSIPPIRNIAMKRVAGLDTPTPRWLKSSG